MTSGSRAVRLGLLLVVVLTAGLGVLDARRDGVTADEPIHLAAGVAQAKYGSWAVNVELPPLAKELWGRAALRAGAVETPSLSFRDLFLTARAQLFGAADPLKVLFAARLVTVAFLLALLLLAARAAGGGEAGLFAAALLAGQTALLPHGHLVTSDVPAAALITAAVWGMLALFERPSAARLLATALAAAAAIATKQTALVLLPLLPLLVVPALRLSREPRLTRRFALVAVGLPLVTLALLALLLRPWTAGEAGLLPTLLSIYRLPEGDAAFVARLAGVDEGLGRYALSTLFVLRQTEAGRLSYFLGDVTAGSPGSSPGYHLVALLVKSPVPWLLLVLAGTIAAFLRAPLRSRLLLFSGAVFLAASFGGPRIGVRHLIPVIVLFSAGAAAAFGPTLLRRSPAAFVIALLLALSPLAFGRSIGRHGLAARFFRAPPLADSNLDWGQDLPRLAELASERGIPPASLGVAYFGGDLPAFRIPGCVDLLSSDAPLPRYVAVSRQLLLVGPETVLFAEGRPRAAHVLAELKARDAAFVARVGDSIDLFEIPPAR